MSLTEREVFRCRRKRAHPEKEVQRACIQWLRARGCLVAVTDAGAAYRAGGFFGTGIPAGWPDITGCTADGRFIGVECKAPKKGRQSIQQAMVEREILRRNGIYILAKSIDDLERSFANDLPQK